MTCDALREDCDCRRPAVGVSWLERLAQWVGLRTFLARRRAHKCAAFNSAFVALAAKMAVADGVAVKAEAEAFERFLELEQADAPNVRRLYDLAKQDVAGYEEYAVRIAAMLVNRPALLCNVFECLLYIACSDGMLHPAEDRFLQAVAKKFGYSERRYRDIRALFVHDPASPYDVLGVDPRISDTGLKTRYRQLVAETHPDRLQARGEPAVVIRAANAKLSAYNAAYDAIVRERRSVPEAAE